jgi:hypothetical protein
MVVAALTVEEMIYGWTYPEPPLITAEPTVKLIPLLQPPVRARTDARTNPSAQRTT